MSNCHWCNVWGVPTALNTLMSIDLMNESLNLQWTLDNTKHLLTGEPSKHQKKAEHLLHKSMASFFFWHTHCNGNGSVTHTIRHKAKESKSRTNVINSEHASQSIDDLCQWRLRRRGRGKYLRHPATSHNKLLGAQQCYVSQGANQLWVMKKK